MIANTVSPTAASAGLRGRLACSATASFCSGCGPTCTTGFSGATCPAGLSGTTCAAGTAGLSNTACTTRAAGSSGGSTVLVSGGLISVWRVAAMLRVVLPVLVRAVDVILLVVVVYVLVVDVHVHVPVVPAAVVAPTSTPRRAEGESRSECQGGTGDVSRISDRRIRIRRSTVNSRGVIRRYVNRVGISGLNHDRLLTAVDRLRLNFLLRACL